jgi:hypothetical protein
MVQDWRELVWVCAKFCDQVLAPTAHAARGISIFLRYIIAAFYCLSTILLYANFYSFMVYFMLYISYMVLSFFPYFNLAPFTNHHASSSTMHHDTMFCRRSRRATFIESIEYPGNGDIQTSEHEEITIYPVIQATIGPSPSDRRNARRKS